MNKKTIIISLSYLSVSLFMFSCEKGECQECIKTACGIASCDEIEKMRSCSQAEIDSLENSNSGNVYWTCE